MRPRSLHASTRGFATTNTTLTIASMFEARDLKQDLFALALLVLVVFLACALLTYDPADPLHDSIFPLNHMYRPDTLVHPPNDEISNASGHWGALVADVLLNTFGWGAYYLVFSAFVLMSTNFSAQADWGGTLAGQLGGDGELFRIAGLLLVMGILHTVTIAVLPVMGLIFASNWRRAARTQLGKEAPEPDPQAEKADRVATLIVWLVPAGLAAMALLFIVPGIIGAILGAE